MVNLQMPIKRDNTLKTLKVQCRPHSVRNVNRRHNITVLRHATCRSVAEIKESLATHVGYTPRLLCARHLKRLPKVSYGLRGTKIWPVERVDSAMAGDDSRQYILSTTLVVS